MAELKIRPRKTLEDYLRLPDDVRAELIEGEILMSPSPTPRHQRISKKLCRYLDTFVSAQKLGEILYAPLDVHLPSGDMVQPDLVYISAAQRAIITEKRIEGVPELLVEILSLSNPERDLIVKRALYARNGVKEYWIVDGEARTIEVNLLNGTVFVPAGCFQLHETLTSPMLPSLSLPVRTIFE